MARREHEERIEKRGEERRRFLGVPEYAYPQMLARAVRHALRPPTAGDPPWLCVGPRNVAGRVLALAQDSINTSTLYAGTAHGGLWRTVDAGDTWTHLGGPEHTFPVGAIGIPTQRSDRLYVGTGAQDPTHVSGQGLFRVDIPPNGPAVFTALADAPEPEVTPRSARDGAALRYTRIEVDPDDPDQFWAASQTGLWRCKITNAPPNRTWIRDFPIGNVPASAQLPDQRPSFDEQWPSYATDLRVACDPRDPSRSRDDARKARFLILYLAINNSGVFRGRFDRDERDPAKAVTWDDMLGVPTPALPSPFQWVALAICRNSPSHVYAVFAADSGKGNPEHNHASAVYRSDDSGDQWHRRGQIPRAYGYEDEPGSARPNTDGQANYDLVLEVNPDDPEILVCGEIDLCRSEDGGATWTPILNWQTYDDGDYAQHADQHALMFDAADRKRIWAGNDGGLSVAADLHGTAAALGFWRRRSHGIIAGQFEDVTAHPSAGFHFMSGGGLQDNGTWIGYGGMTWYHVGGGDGGTLQIHATDPRIYLTGVANDFALTTIEPTGPLVNPVLPEVPLQNHAMAVDTNSYGIPGSGPFVSVFVQDPTTPGQAMIGWAVSAGAPDYAYWAAPPVPAGVGASPAANPGAVTAIVLPAPAAFAGEEASAVAFGPVIAGVPSVYGWIGTTDGRVFRTDTAPVGPWTEVTSNFGVDRALRGVERIAVHPSDPRIVALACNPSTRSATVTVLAGGQFQVTLIDPPSASAPINIPPAGTSVALPGTAIVVEFPAAAAAYAAGNQWSVSASGVVTTVSGANPLNALFTQGAPIRIAISTAGAVRTAMFKTKVGAFAESAEIRTDDTVEVLGTNTVLSFTGGPFAVGDTWTIEPNNTVTLVGAARPGVVALLARLHGRVFLTYDRGVKWTDISYPATPPAAGAGDANSLPPCVVSGLTFDLDQTNPAAPVLSLFVGTLVGIYVMRNIPTPTAVAVAPAAPPAIRTGAGAQLQLTANVTFSDGAGVQNCTTQVDWVVDPAAPAGILSVSNAAGQEGQVTGLAAGTVNIQARRGALPVASVPVTANAAAAAQPAPGPPAAMPVPAFARAWRPFNGTAANALPLVLVTDIEKVEVPNPPAPQPRRLLRAATFGRGIWESELTGGGPQHQLFIRQTLTENGRLYPRDVPPHGALIASGDSDYRLPANVAFGYDFTHAFDIRVDSGDLGFFDDRVDGVEFDEQIGADTVIPKARNAVYVQLHNAGWEEVPNVTVHLFFVDSVDTPLAPPPAANVPAGLPNPATFYTAANLNAALPAQAPHTAWQRVAPQQTLPRPLRPYEPFVLRFDWVPPETLATSTHIALLAICTAAADPLTAPVPMPATPHDFITQERHAALRVVAVGPLPPRRVFIRDGVDDSGRLGEVAFVGRSPDIIVVPANLAPADAVAAHAAFKDLLDQRPQDRIQGAVQNQIFVRVHSAGPLPANVEVHLWAVKLDANNAPAAVAAWTSLTPNPPNPATAAQRVTVPPGDVGYVQVSWPPPPVADPNPADAAYKAYALVALIAPIDTGGALLDPLPDTARVTDVAKFWELFGNFFDSDHAAVRVLRYVP